MGRYGRGPGFFLPLREIKEHLCLHAVRYCIAGVCFLLGIVFGCIGISGVSRSVSFLEIRSFGVIYVMGTNVRFGLIFWRRIWSTALAFAVILLFNLVFYLIPAGYVYMVYRGYILGFNVALLIAMYGVGGFFNALIFIIPQQLILSAGCIVCLSLCHMRACARRDSRFSACDYPWLLPRVGLLYAAVVLLALVEAIITPMFSFLILY